MALLQPEVHFPVLTPTTPADPTMTALSASRAPTASRLITDRGIRVSPVPEPSRPWLAPACASNWPERARASHDARPRPVASEASAPAGGGISHA